MAKAKNLLEDFSTMEPLFDGEFGELIRNQYPKIERRENLTPEEFNAEYLQLSKPVILTNANKDWPALKKWDLNFFKNKYGKTELYTNLYDSKNIRTEQMYDFITRVQNRKDGDKPEYIQEWLFQNTYPELLEDYDIPRHFSNDWMKKLYGYNYTTLWMGSAASKTFIHQDSVHANIWIAQVHGYKEWYLFDKSASLQDESGVRSFLDNDNNKAQYEILGPGDILFVPYKWWHRAKAVTDSISLNTFFLTEHLSQFFVKEFLAIPVAVALKGDELKEENLMRYNICKMRLEFMEKAMKIDVRKILGLDKYVNDKI